jgi:hypothetical protein
MWTVDIYHWRRGHLLRIRWYLSTFFAPTAYAYEQQESPYRNHNTNNPKIAVWSSRISITIIIHATSVIGSRILQGIPIFARYTFITIASRALPILRWARIATTTIWIISRVAFITKKVITAWLTVIRLAGECKMRMI